MNVQDTVLEVMRNDYSLRGYEDRATPVIDALRERERVAVESLIDFAVSKGLSEQEAREAVATAGLEVIRAASNGDGERIAAVEEKLEALLDEIRSLRH
jgi:hypothetical protein